MIDNEDDQDEFIEETINMIKGISSKFEEIENQLLFYDEDDKRNAFLNIHPGAGGVESCDWASMLYRMYLRWIERKGFKYSMIDYQPGNEAGIKNVTLMVEGINVFGHLKAERGIHRLVRISPFDSNSRRHTSFASVEALPEVDDNIEIEIDENDLKIDTYRSTGHGGQSVNTTDSAVRITHVPTGIIVQCQNERSQHQNRANAMKVLKSRLYEFHKSEQEKERLQYEKSKKDIAWGNQIRSYVFHPYTMVKDHRTNVEVGNGQSVMDGDIDQFIYTYLRAIRTDI